jgi:hypothetical protein
LILTATPTPEEIVTQIASETPSVTMTETSQPTATNASTATSFPTNTPVPQPTATEPAGVTAEPTQAAGNSRGLLPCGSSLLSLVGFLALAFRLRGGKSGS